MPTPRSGARGRGRGGRAAPGVPAVPWPSPALPPEWPWRFIFIYLFILASTPHKRLIIAGVGASLWLPPGLGFLGFANLPFPEQLCRRLRRPEKLGKLESGSITGTSLWPPGWAELRRWWRRMRRAYQTGWVGETRRGGQVLICPGFHLIDWLQSKWGL